MNSIETFPDGSMIETDCNTGNRTVIGVQAHNEYLFRMRQAQSEEIEMIRQRKPATHNFFLKDQAQRLLDSWKVTEPLPSKNKKLVVAFPRDGKHECSRIDVYLSAHKSTYGKPLYLFEFYI